MIWKNRNVLPKEEKRKMQILMTLYFHKQNSCMIMTTYIWGDIFFPWQVYLCTQGNLKFQPQSPPHIWPKGHWENFQIVMTVIFLRMPLRGHSSIHLCKFFVFIWPYGEDTCACMWVHLSFEVKFSFKVCNSVPSCPPPRSTICLCKWSPFNYFMFGICRLANHYRFGERSSWAEKRFVADRWNVVHMQLW